jgi:hypothetical protein
MREPFQTETEIKIVGHRYKILICILTIFLFHIPSLSYAQNEGLDLEYTLTIDNPSSHILKVELKVNNLAPQQLKLARLAGYQTNPAIFSMIVKDNNGSSLTYEIDHSDKIHEIYIIDSDGVSSITLEYSVDLEYFEQPVSRWNLDSFYGAVESQLIFLQPIVNPVDSCRISANLPTGWKMISRLIKNGNFYEANIDDKVTTTLVDSCEPYHFLIWGPLVFGEFDEYFNSIGGFEAEVAFYGGEELQPQFSELIFSILSYLTETIGPLNNPPNSSRPIKYLFVYLWETQRIVHAGDHILGQVTTINENTEGSYRPDNRLRMDAHIVTHTWFSHFDLLPNVIHVYEPNEEGIIQFYAVKSLEKTGIWNPSDVNEELKQWFNSYTIYILGTEYDVPIFPASGWRDFPGEIGNIIPYNKLPLVYRLLDWKIGDVTQGLKSLDDVWRFCHKYYPGNFMSHSNLENCSKKKDTISYDELLNICNYVTGFDFTEFFEKYLSGIASLPYYLEGNNLKIDYSKIPNPSPISNIELVRIRLSLGRVGVDTDEDSLPNELEQKIGTNSLKSDTDADGLSDREEFGVIIDGRGDEKLGNALISDPQGDSDSSLSPTDIKEVFANIFVDEYSIKHLYLLMNFWDIQFSPEIWFGVKYYNPEVWYEFYLTPQNFTCRFENEEFILFGPNGTIIPRNVFRGNFSSLMEVTIPMETVGNGEVYISAQTRYDYHLPMAKVADYTEDTVFQLENTIYITNPLNSDTDRDSYPDGMEVNAGTDPTDWRSCPGLCPTRASPWIPLLLLDN